MKEEKKDRALRNTFLLFADLRYSAIKDDFVSAVKIAAKEKYGIELSHGLEMLLKGAYEVGFADAMELGIDRDAHDESY